MKYINRSQTAAVNKAAPRYVPSAEAGEKTAGKKDILYHGSPSKFDVLEPRSDHGDPDVGPSVFATPSRTFALAYTGGKKWGDRDIEQGTRGGGKTPWTMQLREMRPGAFQEHFGGPGYIYHLPGDSFVDAGRRTRVEKLSPTAVTPEHVEEIGSALDALREDSSVTLATYDPNHPATRAAVRRSIKRMQGMDPDSAAEYRQWRMEVSPPELKALFEEEEKQASVREEDEFLKRAFGFKGAELKQGR